MFPGHLSATYIPQQTSSSSILKAGAPIGKILGGVLGVLALLAALSACLWWWRQQRMPADTLTEYSPYIDLGMVHAVHFRVETDYPARKRRQTNNTH